MPALTLLAETVDFCRGKQQKTELNYPEKWLQILGEHPLPQH